jgi:hypothetical protein
MKRFATIIALFSLFMSAPAHAALVFGGTGNPFQWRLQAGNQLFFAQDTGWISEEGEHNTTNGNYLAGVSRGLEYRNFAVFDLSNLSGLTTTANLRISTVFINGPLTYSLYGSDARLDELDLQRAPGDADGIALFNSIGSGTFYGSRDYTVADRNTSQTIELNAAAVAEINAAAGGQFSFVGAATQVNSPVPEPSTWLMLMLGLFGIGSVLRLGRKEQSQRALSV